MQTITKLTKILGLCFFSYKSSNREGLFDLKCLIIMLLSYMCESNTFYCSFLFVLVVFVFVHEYQHIIKVYKRSCYKTEVMNKDIYTVPTDFLFPFLHFRFKSAQASQLGPNRVLKTKWRRSRCPFDLPLLTTHENKTNTVRSHWPV